MKTRKTLLTLTIALLTLALFAGCSGTAKEDKTEKTEPEDIEKVEEVEKVKEEKKEEPINQYTAEMERGRQYGHVQHLKSCGKQRFGYRCDGAGKIPDGGGWRGKPAGFL